MMAVWEQLAEHGALVLASSCIVVVLWRRVRELHDELRTVRENHAAEIREMSADTIELLKTNSAELLAAFASGQQNKPIALVESRDKP
jgi:hypothetical protein